jgi:hypothetical protein
MQINARQTNGPPPFAPQGDGRPPLDTQHQIRSKYLPRSYEPGEVGIECLHLCMSSEPLAASETLQRRNFVQILEI